MVKRASLWVILGLAAVDQVVSMLVTTLVLLAITFFFQNVCWRQQLKKSDGETGFRWQRVMASG
jgi:hypothetical protein